MRVEGKPPGVDDIITDHGALGGLGDDDHAQYHTDARGDARYWPLSTNLATQAELDAHVDDTSDAHDASAISIVDAGGLYTGATVEAALQEVGTEAGLAGTNIQEHLDDTADAHDASAISILDTGNDFTATDVEGALAELQADHETDATALSAHIADGTAAHAASAISYLGGTGMSATDVEAALDELATEKLNIGDAMQDGDAAGGVLDGTYPNPGLAASVAGDGLAETANVLSVRVDDSTIQINADILRVKAGGITAAHVAADVATQAELDAHTGDATDAHDASAISVLDVSGLLAADNVEGALAELATDADNHLADAADAHDASAISVADAGARFTGTDVETVLAEIWDLGVSGDHGGLSGLGDDDHAQYHTDARGDARYWQLGTNLATQVELDDHINDATAAHAATAIAFTPHGSIAATTVQAAIQEVRDEAGSTALHKASHEDGGADEISLTGLSGTPTVVADHLADATDAHDASAISILDAGGYFVIDNVEAALQQIAAAGGAGGAPNAEDVDITDVGGYYTGTDVEAALQEVGALLDAPASVAVDDVNLILHMGVFA